MGAAVNGCSCQWVQLSMGAAVIEASLTVQDKSILQQDPMKKNDNNNDNDIPPTTYWVSTIEILLYT